MERKQMAFLFVYLPRIGSVMLTRSGSMKPRSRNIWNEYSLSEYSNM